MSFFSNHKQPIPQRKQAGSQIWTIQSCVKQAVQSSVNSPLATLNFLKRLGNIATLKDIINENQTTRIEALEDLGKKDHILAFHFAKKFDRKQDLNIGNNHFLDFRMGVKE